MTDDRAPIAIALFWGAFIAILAFFGTKSTWYDTWKTSEQIDFWVAAGTLLLAAGTILLAWYTSRSVEITAHVLRDEQVRHQQGFAPLVKLQDPNYDHGFGITVLKNVGEGVALNVVAHVSFKYTPSQPPADQTETYSYTVFVSAIEKRGEASDSNEEVQALNISMRSGLYDSLIIEYDDMFGNPYKTRYYDTPGSSKWFLGLSMSFKWERPPNLQFQKGRDRDSDIAGDEPEARH